MALCGIDEWGFLDRVGEMFQWRISCQHLRFKHLNFLYIYPISYKIAKKANPQKRDLLKLKNDITRIFIDMIRVIRWRYLIILKPRKTCDQSRVDRRNLTSSPPQIRAWISRFIRLLPAILLKPLGLKPTQKEIQLLPVAGWLSSSASWLIPFAPAPLQSLQHYYRMIRPLHVHRYFPPSWSSLIGFSLNITWRVPKFRTKA